MVAAQGFCDMATAPTPIASCTGAERTAARRGQFVRLTEKSVLLGLRACLFDPLVKFAPSCAEALAFAWKNRFDAEQRRRTRLVVRALDQEGLRVDCLG